MVKKSKFFWLKIAITIISFGGAVLFKSTIDWTNIQNNYIDLSLLKEIAYDLGVGVFRPGIRKEDQVHRDVVLI